MGTTVRTAAHANSSTDHYNQAQPSTLGNHHLFLDALQTEDLGGVICGQLDWPHLASLRQVCTAMPAVVEQTLRDYLVRCGFDPACATSAKSFEPATSATAYAARLHEAFRLGGWVPAPLSVRGSPNRLAIDAAALAPLPEDHWDFDFRNRDFDEFRLNSQQRGFRALFNGGLDSGDDLYLSSAAMEPLDEAEPVHELAADLTERMRAFTPPLELPTRLLDEPTLALIGELLPDAQYEVRLVQAAVADRHEAAAHQKALAVTARLIEADWNRHERGALHMNSQSRNLNWNGIMPTTTAQGSSSNRTGSTRRWRA